MKVRASLLLTLAVVSTGALFSPTASADSIRKIEFVYSPESSGYNEGLLTRVWYRPSGKGTVSFQTYVQSEITRHTTVYPIVTKRFSIARDTKYRWYWALNPGLESGFYKAWVVAYRNGKKVTSRKYFQEIGCARLC
jgi:hypothetical protein